MDPDFKRLFFGMEVNAPWPEELPYGRILDVNHRHLTLAFLGKIDFSQLKRALETFPPPNFKVGSVGKFDQCLFLPPKHPHVVAWHVEWLEKSAPLNTYYHQFVEWLQSQGFSPDLRHDFNPHVTLARTPFNEKTWKKKFVPLPMYTKDIHLYESVGNLRYEPIWSHPLLAPFDEIDHTADIAFWIRGETYSHLFQHAQIALAFEFPPLLPFLVQEKQLDGIEEVINALNEIVFEADKEIGIPFKAVSFHMDHEKKNHTIYWEMIIDV